MNSALITEEKEAFIHAHRNRGHRQFIDCLLTTDCYPEMRSVNLTRGLRNLNLCKRLASAVTDAVSK